jgi:cysteine dioxygenase
MKVFDQSATHTFCSVEDLVQELDQLPQSAFSDVQNVLQILISSRVKPNTLNPFLTWDKQHYTRNLIHKTDLYELIAICWEPGQFSSIHNHQDQNCWMAAPVGRLVVQNYRVLFQNIEQGRCALETADRLEMAIDRPAAVDPENPVHCVYNPIEFNQRAVSLHVYSRPFDKCIVYSQERGTCGVINLRYTAEYNSPATKPL